MQRFPTRAGFRPDPTADPDVGVQGGEVPLFRPKRVRDEPQAGMARLVGLGREILGDYLRHRLYGERHHRHGYWPIRGRRHGVFRPRRHRGVEVRGCGCCLPIPIGVLAGTGLGLRLLLVRSRS